MCTPRLSLHSYVLRFAVVALVACTATPLPTPPSLSVEKLELSEPKPDRVSLRGAAGAISPGGVVLRVTGPLDAVERPVAEAGSFAAELGGTRADTFFLEVVRDGASVFLGAVTGGPDSTAVPAEPGADSDEDDSPDGVDCAPNDPATNGRACSNGDPANCVNLPETCNGLDDDCDGLADDGTCTCDTNDACNANQRCDGNTCSDANALCVTETDCEPGQTCDRGVCR